MSISARRSFSQLTCLVHFFFGARHRWPVSSNRLVMRGQPQTSVGSTCQGQNAECLHSTPGWWLPLCTSHPCYATVSVHQSFMQILALSMQQVFSWSGIKPFVKCFVLSQIFLFFVCSGLPCCQYRPLVLWSVPGTAVWVSCSTSCSEGCRSRRTWSCLQSWSCRWIQNTSGFHTARTRHSLHIWVTNEQQHRTQQYNWNKELWACSSILLKTVEWIAFNRSAKTHVSV